MYRYPLPLRATAHSSHSSKQLASCIHRYLFTAVRFVALAFLTMSILSLSVISTLAASPQQHRGQPQQHKSGKPTQHKGGKPTQPKGGKPTQPQQPVYQGLILQVDSSNSSDIVVSTLDKQNTPMTFHVTSSTKFAAHQSAAQLAVNLLISVKDKTGASGELDATWINIQKRSQAPLNVQGVVTSTNQGQRSMTLALTDGTILTITITHKNIPSTLLGASVSLQAHANTTGTLVASTYRIMASHAKHFQVQGIISHIDASNTHLTLVTPSGAAITIIQKHSAHATKTLHVGEKVEIRGSVDSKGNLDEQSVSIENTNEQHLTIEGVVSAIDPTTNTFSLIDNSGNVITLNANSSLLASIHVGGIYRVEATIQTDGSLTAIKIKVSEGDDQGNTFSLEGTVQTYDASTGTLTILGGNGETFTLIVNSQTQISADDGASSTLTSGQEIKVSVQHNADGSFTALEIEIQQNAETGVEITFDGAFQSYDTTSGQLVISTSAGQKLSFATNAQTKIEGTNSLNALPVGTLIKVKAQLQQDGSYVATKVGVPDTQGNNLSQHK